jgi:aldose 1-epimerase
MVAESMFGRVDGWPAHAYMLDSGEGVSLRVTDYGARLVSLWVPGRDGRAEDIVLGFDDAESYVRSTAYFGATVGRYGNRIARGQFTLLGEQYRVDCNEGANHLHGGRHGWDSRLWDVEVADTSVTFRTRSAPGEMGFPGGCEVTSTYELLGRSLRITMEAIPSETTVINMVHHSYYNLAGHASGNVLTQQMRLPSDFYTPVDEALLATGEILAVAATPYDFRELRPIRATSWDAPAAHSDVAIGDGGYDHNWCLRGGGADLSEASEAFDPGSGRRLNLWTSEPGVQMYTGGYLDDQIIGKGGSRYCKNAGFTLETQKFPDSPRFSHFPTATVLAGDLYRHEMLLVFSTA